MHDDSADVACLELLENGVLEFTKIGNRNIPIASVSDPSARAII